MPRGHLYQKEYIMRYILVLVSMFCCALNGMISRDKAISEYNSGGSSIGSRLWRELYNRSQYGITDAEEVKQKIKILEEQNNANPEFQKKIAEWSLLTPEQIKKENRKYKKELKKMKQEHRNTLKYYSWLNSLCRKTLLAGYHLYIAYLGNFAPSYEKELWGASVGVSAVGLAGMAGVSLSTYFLQQNEPTLIDAIKRIQEKNKISN